ADAVAADLGRLAVGAAAVAAHRVAVVADLALVGVLALVVEDPVAAALVGLAVAAAAVAVLDVAVVADLAVAALHRAVATGVRGGDADVLHGGAVVVGGADQPVAAGDALGLHAGAEQQEHSERDSRVTDGPVHPHGDPQKRPVATTPAIPGPSRGPIIACC